MRQLAELVAEARWVVHAERNCRVGEQETKDVITSRLSLPPPPPSLSPFPPSHAQESQHRGKNHYTLQANKEISKIRDGIPPLGASMQTGTGRTHQEFTETIMCRQKVEGKVQAKVQ